MTNVCRDHAWCLTSMTNNCWDHVGTWISLLVEDQWPITAGIIHDTCISVIIEHQWPKLIEKLAMYFYLCHYLTSMGYTCSRSYLILASPSLFNITDHTCRVRAWNKVSLLFEYQWAELIEIHQNICTSVVIEHQRGILTWVHAWYVPISPCWISRTKTCRISSCFILKCMSPLTWPPNNACGLEGYHAWCLHLSHYWRCTGGCMILYTSVI